MARALARSTLNPTLGHLVLRRTSRINLPALRAVSPVPSLSTLTRHSYLVTSRFLLTNLTLDRDRRSAAVREAEIEGGCPAAQRAQRASSPDRGAGANGATHDLDRPSAGLAPRNGRPTVCLDRRERQRGGGRGERTVRTRRSARSRLGGSDHRSSQFSAIQD